MQTNVKTDAGTAYQQLRRSVMSCLLWEDTFYEDGVSIADRISTLASQVDPVMVASLAVEARTVYKLRHVPLLLLDSLVRTRGGSLTAAAIENTVLRPDEMGELLSLYWRDGRKPLTRSLKVGLSRAFIAFSRHQLAKYSGRGKPITLRDVMRLVHPKPLTEEQSETFRMIADDTLPPPETWEVLLSRGDDKRATFEHLIREGKLGYLALLRNLRNMVAADCDLSLVRRAIIERRGAEMVLPFRYLAAARACPQLEPEIDLAMLDALSELPTLPGRTVCLVDVSGSMHCSLSSRSDLTRADAAAALASILRCDDLRVFSFSDDVVEVPARRGMAGVDAVLRSQQHRSTYLGEAVAFANSLSHDRLIVITDEQSHDPVPPPVCQHAYMVNVASYRHGVGYLNGWTRLDGFSEGVVRYLDEIERG